MATEGYPGGNRAIIWDISPERLRNGLPAVEVVGHLNDDGHTDFERRSANDRATPRNIYPRDVELDPIDHRLFAIDQYNNRVLVWQLDSQNRVLDRDAKWVYGQPDLYSGELYPIGPTTIKIPLAVTYDPHHKRAFVSDGWGNRIMVFDAHPDRLKNGPGAIAVLGQPDFTSTTPATSRAGINLDTRVGTGITPTRPRGTGLAYDPVHDRVFVSDGGNNRVLVYDVAPDSIASGMPASVVLGLRSAAHELDVYKIGFTRRNAEQRAKEISSATGVPLPFGVIMRWDVGQCAVIEREVHDKLVNRRINPAREFFRATLQEIHEVVRLAIAKFDGDAG